MVELSAQFIWGVVSGRSRPLSSTICFSLKFLGLIVLWCLEFIKQIWDSVNLCSSFWSGGVRLELSLRLRLSAEFSELFLLELLHSLLFEFGFVLIGEFRL